MSIDDEGFGRREVILNATARGGHDIVPLPSPPDPRRRSRNPLEADPHVGRQSHAAPSEYTDDQWDALQWVSLEYDYHQTNRVNGLVADKSMKGSPCSITAVGMALAKAPLVAERGFLLRTEVARRVLTKLRFFRDSPQGPEPDATGYKGFYYHFLDMQTGRRVWQCELSTIDSAFLLAGMLTAAVYFDRDTEDEAEIRALADALYRRVDWRWAMNGGPSVTHGWRPESGFIPYRWTGYDEALLLYLLGLGSPTYPLSEESFAASTSIEDPLPRSGSLRRVRFDKMERAGTLLIGGFISFPILHILCHCCISAVSIGRWTRTAIRGRDRAPIAAARPPRSPRSLSSLGSIGPRRDGLSPS